MRDTAEIILHAIHVRNEVDKALQDRDWVTNEVRVMIADGFWNDPQIAQITGLTRQRVGVIGRDCERPAVRPAGGTLDRKALDIILMVRGSVLSESGMNAELLREAVKTGTSTRLLARLFGVGVGVVLYQQRLMKEEARQAAAAERARIRAEMK